MSIILETGDILEKTHYNLIVQQVNCQGVMGAGLAKQIVDKYPIVLDQFNKFNSQVPNYQRLGNILITPIGKKSIVNFFSQFEYGRDKKIVYTNYYAFKDCLNKLNEFLYNSKLNLNIAFPYKIGCGLGNGNWDTIFTMIEEFDQKIPFEDSIYICKRVNR